MFRPLFCLVAALCSLVPTGCGGGAARPKAETKYKIGVIPKGMTHEFWQSIKRGADRAAADLGESGLGVEVLWDGPRRESDALEQTSLVEQMAGSRGIHGLVLAPQHSKSMVDPVKAVVARKIPVVIIDSGLDDESLYVKYVATDNKNGGRMAADHLLKILADAGKDAPKLVLFRYAPGSESTEQRETGFTDRIAEVIAERKKAGKPAPEIIDAKEYAGATVDSAQKVAGPLVLRIKDKADGIFAVNESCATGMLNELRSQKVNGKIALVAFDSSEPLLSAVEAGDVGGLIVQDPYRMGYLAVRTLVDHLEGKPTGKGKTRSTGEYLLTRENLKSVESRQLFEPTLQKKRTIEVKDEK